jgi:hypothetical protein
MKLRATLDKGPTSRVQWNQAVLLSKSFKLVPRSLDKDLDQDKSNCDLVYMISFWKENRLVQTKKTHLKESSAHGLENQSVT